MVRSMWVLFTGSARAKQMIVLICRLCGDHVVHDPRHKKRKKR